MIGVLVVFDGPNCSGKSTLIEKVCDTLSKDYCVYITGEPTKDEFGKYLKENHYKISPIPYLFLITANRAYHNDEIMKNNHKLILCDRYIPSSLALQQTSNVSLEFIWEINQKFIMPDITFFISASKNELEERLATRCKKSFVEEKYTRKEEIDLYKSAFDFMKKKLDNVFWLENNNSSNLKNIDFIIKTIKKMTKKM